MCVALVLGKCQFEKAIESDCPATVSAYTTPPCNDGMPNDQVCEGDNPLPDGQIGAWIDSLDNCAPNHDVFKCMRGKS